MKRRVLIITNLYPYPWDRTRGVFNYQQIYHLSKYYDIDALIPIAWPEYIKHKEKYRAELEKWHMEGDITVYYVPRIYVPRVAPFTHGATMLLSLWKPMRHLLMKKNYQAVFASWGYPDALAACIVAKRYQTRCLVKLHGSDVNYLTNLMGVKKQVSWLLRACDGVICVSKDLARKAIHLGSANEKTHVVYNGIDTELFHCNSQTKNQVETKYNLKAASRIILYVGNIKITKGCVELVRACARVLDPNDRLIFVGDGPDRGKVYDLAAEMGITDRVIFAGKRPHQELPGWYQAADLLALPSHNEGVPNVILEAMACGCPVVATAVGGIPEVLNEHAGILVAEADTLELETALRTALKIKWNRDEIMNSAAPYTWDTNAKQLDTIIKSVQ